MSTPRPDLSQRRTKVDVKPAPDLDIDPIDLAPAPQPSRAIPAVAPPESKPVKPVRITTDVTPAAYRALTAFSGELAASLGRPKIAHTEVVRALLAQLEDDPELRITIAAKITANLRKSASQ